jgi:hypothetical protein
LIQAYKWHEANAMAGDNCGVKEIYAALAAIESMALPKLGEPVGKGQVLPPRDVFC